MISCVSEHKLYAYVTCHFGLPYCCMLWCTKYDFEWDKNVEKKSDLIRNWRWKTCLYDMVHSKMTITWKYPHPQIIQDVDEFVSSSDLEKCVSASVSHQWMLCSEWVPSEWESDKNITIIHTTPVHQLTSGEDKSWNKSSIKMFLTTIHNP